MNYLLAGPAYRVLVAFLALYAFLGSPASWAQTVGERGANRGGEGETHMVLTDGTTPQKRAAFREYMETKGVDQFEEWKKQGVLKSYLLLFSTSVNEHLPDMWAILDFAKFDDVTKWQDIDRKAPGGLSPEGLELGSPKTSVYTDLAGQGGKNGEPAKAMYMIIPYITLVSVDKYEDFVDKYVIPQLKGWVKTGLMPSYQIHMNQNPTNAPWHSLLVFEYDGIRGIALRDTAKQGVRDVIKDDPGYKQYSPIKTGIRKELEPTTFTVILPKK